MYDACPHQTQVRSSLSQCGLIFPVAFAPTLCLTLGSHRWLRMLDEGSRYEWWWQVRVVKHQLTEEQTSTYNATTRLWQELGQVLRRRSTKVLHRTVQGCCAGWGWEGRGFWSARLCSPAVVHCVHTIGI